MSRNVLSGDEIRFLSDGFPVENGAWQGVIRQRAQEDTQRRHRHALPVVSGGEGEIVPADVFRELGSEAIPVSVEPVDPRQAAIEEAEALLQRAQEEAETLASNIKEDAKARAAMMVEKAQAEVKEILENAKTGAEAEIDRLKRVASEEGRKTGLEQGMSEGRVQGSAEAKAEVAGVLADWNSVLGKTVEERKRTLTESEPLVVELVGDALYRCLQDEGVHRPEMVLRFVAEVLKKAHDRVHLMVHLNPADLATVEAKKTELQFSIGSSRIELVPDGRIEKGGCLLETEAGSIDARLSTVVSQVKGALSPGM